MTEPAEIHHDEDQNNSDLPHDCASADLEVEFPPTEVIRKQFEKHLQVLEESIEKLRRQLNGKIDKTSNKPK